MNTHYDENYFNWQHDIGFFGGWANLVKFEEFITEDMNVIDFGCGGGFLLKNIRCKNKIGIEINDVARESASKRGIQSFKYVAEAPDDWADIIISNNALEHVNEPLSQLVALRPKLKKGGRIIFVVPCDSIKYEYVPNDVNYHLFSWSPMNLGNLFTEAGYKVIESKSFIHKWPPYYHTIAVRLGKRLFNLACRIYGHIETSWYQVRVVAEKV
ncbi:MAG: class I SAM-dependent methyltransferase [Bacteroidota bacterium]